MSRTPRTPSDIYPSLTYDDASAAIAWLGRAFGFVARLVVPGPDGTVRHSELSFGTGVIMVSSGRPEQHRVGPRASPTASHGLCVYVDDPDAHCARSLAAGATLVQPLRDEEFGARGYMVKDPEGHVWYFGNYRPGSHWVATSAS